MIRKSNTIPKDVDFIFTSDWHLREDVPICRTDVFEESQWRKVRQIKDLQKRLQCPVIHAGDLFHHWKPSPYLLAATMKELPDEFWTVYGQHDLPQHNWNLRHKSGIYVLQAAGSLKVLEGGSWNQKVSRIPNTKIGVTHRFVWDGEKIPWPGCEETTALELLKKNKKYDLIISGDHHRPFIYTYKGRQLVNCGCLTRQDASYAEHLPRIWLCSGKNITPYYLDINKDAVSKIHLQRKAEKEQRIEAFVSRLDDEWETSISFKDNLNKFLKKNKVKKSVLQLIYNTLEK